MFSVARKRLWINSKCMATVEKAVKAVEAAEVTKYHNLSLVLFTNKIKEADPASHPKSPDYFLKYKISDKKWALFGAAWKAKSGGTSIQVSLDLDKVASYEA